MLLFQAPKKTKQTNKQTNKQKQNRKRFLYPTLPWAVHAYQNVFEYPRVV